MAIYTWRYEPDTYLAVYTLYAEPAARSVPDAQAMQMLARELDALTRMGTFRRKVLGGAEIYSDGSTYVRATLLQGTHMIAVQAAGPDARSAQSLANGVGQALLKEAQETFGAEKAREISQAELPREPYGPDRIHKVLRTMLITLAAGSLLGCLFGSESAPVRWGGRDAAMLRVPVLGGAVDLEKAVRQSRAKHKKHRQGRTVFACADRLMKESVRTAALQLTAALRPIKAKSVVFASIRREPQQPALVAMLASELSMQGYRVLVMDLDGREAQLRRMLGMESLAVADVVDVLSGRVALGSAIGNTAPPVVSFLDEPHQATEVVSLIADKAFDRFLQSACSHYDHVLINAAPLSAGADAGLLGARADATVLIVPDGQCRADEIDTAATELAEVTRCMAGVLFTSVRCSRFDLHD